MQEFSNSKYNFENCVKCHICEDVCPAMKADPSYAGPKRCGPDGERLRLSNPEFFDINIRKCMNCKRCTVACPSGVDVAELIQNAKKEFDNGYGHRRLRDFVLASTDLTGNVFSSTAPLSNAIAASAPARKLMDTAFGIDIHRRFPSYSPKRFKNIFKKNLAATQIAFERKICYFYGCYVQYNYPQLGVDLVKVMNALGIGVALPKKEKCCGLPMICSGLYESAEKNAEENLQSLKSLGLPVITTSTSCALTMNGEYPGILGKESAGVILAEKYIYELICKGSKLKFRPDFKAKVAYHKPCHGEKLGLSIYTRKLMELIPGLELIELNSNCCGIAGTYGFKKENYERSQTIGSDLFEQIREVNPDYLVCECETCKWQIEMSTGYTVENPVSILAKALL